MEDCLGNRVRRKRKNQSKKIIREEAGSSGNKSSFSKVLRNYVSKSTKEIRKYHTFPRIIATERKATKT